MGSRTVSGQLCPQESIHNCGLNATFTQVQGNMLAFVDLVHRVSTSVLLRWYPHPRLSFPPPPPLVFPQGMGGDRHLVNTKILLQVTVIAWRTLVQMRKHPSLIGAGPRNFTPSHLRSKFHYIGSPLNTCMIFISLAHLLLFVIVF